MKRFKVLLAAVVAALTFSAVTASGSQAGTGHFTIGLGGCDVTFASGSVLSPDLTHLLWDHSQELTAFTIDPSGFCDGTQVDGEQHLHWNDNGAAEMDGWVELDGLCTYSGKLTGTFSSGAFTLSPSFQTLMKTAGPWFYCPVSTSVQFPTSFQP
ncbi:MAG: hypothetical protein J0H98_05510 [Solirubrobacterales bacterium]|nr:hypothetical protein [Solirubrobacterales bacterium]